jgi:uncharacterized cysteine cluster protein YcgN (CxxCxxCC family)
MEMEKIILALIITLALLFLIFKMKKAMKGFTQDEFEQNCSGCGGCCNTDCMSKNQINLEEKK